MGLSKRCEQDFMNFDITPKHALTISHDLTHLTHLSPVHHAPWLQINSSIILRRLSYPLQIPFIVQFVIDCLKAEGGLPNTWLQFTLTSMIIMIKTPFWPLVNTLALQLHVSIHQIHNCNITFNLHCLQHHLNLPMQHHHLFWVLQIKEASPIQVCISQGLLNELQQYWLR